MSALANNFLIWPYDELMLESQGSKRGVFVIKTPWFSKAFKVDDKDILKAEQLVTKFQDKTLGAHDISAVNWFFSPLVTYPLCYILPRNFDFGNETYLSSEPLSLSDSPSNLLSNMIKDKSLDNVIRVFNDKFLMESKWSWDLNEAITFSKVNDENVDPLSVFSVSRRFHLLSDIELNETSKLIEMLNLYVKNNTDFKKLSGLVIRQNHYITSQCEYALSPALLTSKSAKSSVNNFIKAEAGHDKITERALISLGFQKEDLKLTNTVIILMELFKEIAKTNFLAFSMVVDIFERTSYEEIDPLANILLKGNEVEAANEISLHREINDLGGHENIALDFLSEMKPVSIQYAKEAMRLTELLTLVILRLSTETMEIFEGK